MPLYEFSCKRCGKRFEKLLRVSDGEPPVCPACGFAEVTREVSRVAEGGSKTHEGCSPGGG